MEMAENNDDNAGGIRPFGQWLRLLDIYPSKVLEGDEIGALEGEINPKAYFNDYLFRALFNESRWVRMPPFCIIRNQSISKDINFRTARLQTHQSVQAY